MKINTTKNSLFSALNETNKVIPIRTTLPILSCVLLEARKDLLYITATDLEQTISTTIAAKTVEEGKTALSSGRFLEIVAALPDTQIELSVSSDHQVEINSPQGVYNIIGKDPEEFPETPTLSGDQQLLINTKEFLRIINSTTYAVSKDDLKPALCGIYLNIKENQMTAVSTDGHRLVKYKKTTNSTNPEGSIIVPVKFFNIIKTGQINNETTTIKTSENHIEVNYNNTKIITRIIKETFPDFNSVIPEELKIHIKINKEKFLEAIKRVSIFSNKTTKQINLTFNSNEITISTEDQETRSSAKEHIDCDFSGEGFTVGYNSQYLKEVVQHIQGQETNMFLSGPLTAAVFKSNKNEEGEEITTLLMPLRTQE